MQVLIITENEAQHSCFTFPLQKTPTNNRTNLISLEKNRYILTADSVCVFVFIFMHLDPSLGHFDAIPECQTDGRRQTDRRPDLNYLQRFERFA